MCTKKWWWSVFMGNKCHNTKCLAVVSSSHSRWSLHEFRWYVVRFLLKINGTARYNQDAAVPKRGISKELRLSEQQHLTDDDSLKKVHRCKVCNLKTQVICTTCEVHLQVKCFAANHTS